MQNLAKNVQILAKNGQKSDFSQNEPDRRIPDQVFWIQYRSIWQVFWIQHSIWVKELQKPQTRPSVKLKY